MQEYINNKVPTEEVILYPGVTYLTLHPGSFSDNPKFVLVGEVQAPLDLTGFEYTLEMGIYGGLDVPQLSCEMNKILPASVLYLTAYLTP